MAAACCRGSSSGESPSLRWPRGKTEEGRVCDTTAVGRGKLWALEASTELDMLCYATLCYPKARQAAFRSV